MSKAKNVISAKPSKKELANIRAMDKQPSHKKQLNEMIAEAAYYKAEKRNFTEGFDMQDWLEAEIEINKDTRKH